uniref:Uncharacterized protein n=1 Tax=Spironucleus salmonicida TaxID=348837 RepID=V6LQT6_9EUKA|eukprot:EST46066.1 Hypothetical protein SS50377_14056 [Spironucleus salmonicida]
MRAGHGRVLSSGTGCSFPVQSPDRSDVCGSGPYIPIVKAHTPDLGAWSGGDASHHLGVRQPGGPIKLYMASCYASEGALPHSCIEQQSCEGSYRPLSRTCSLARIPSIYGVAGESDALVKWQWWHGTSPQPTKIRKPMLRCAMDSIQSTIKVAQLRAKARDAVTRPHGGSIAHQNETQRQNHKYLFTYKLHLQICQQVLSNNYIGQLVMKQLDKCQLLTFLIIITFKM